MTETASRSDKGVGLGILFGLLGVGGAVGMLVFASDHLIAGWSFALAMVAGALAIAAIHLYWS